MPRRERLPGEFRTTFTARVRAPSPKILKGDDGRPVQDWMRTGDMSPEVIYVGTLIRLDGRMTMEIQWVDLDNNGHRFAVPHEVVIGMQNAIDRVMKQSKSDSAKRAAATRREQGVVPFQPRDAEKTA